MSRVFFCSEASFEAVLLGSWFEARIEASVSHCHHYRQVMEPSRQKTGRAQAEFVVRGGRQGQSLGQRQGRQVGDRQGR